MTATH